MKDTGGWGAFSWRQQFSHILQYHEIYFQFLSVLETAGFDSSMALT